MSEMKKQTVTIVRDENQPESVEVIAKSIIAVADGFKRMEQSGLTREAAVLLLNDMTKVGKPAIRKILEAAPRLAKVYTVPRKKPEPQR